MYKAYADARIENASGTRPLVGVSVLYHYNNTGHLNQIINNANPNQIFWKATGMNARDQVTDEQYGLSGTAAAITSHRNYYPESGYVEDIQSSNASAATLQSLHYDWQELGNLADRNDLRQNVSELFQYDTLNRLTSAQVTNGGGLQPAVTYAYDAIGNIKCKSDVIGHDCIGTPTGYTYSQAGEYPHAVTAIAGTVNGSYGYDADGNMNNRNGTTVGWNSDNMPTSITQDGSNQSTFNYAPDKHRYKQVAMVSGLSETTIYAGGLEIVSDANGTHNRYQLSAGGKSISIIDLEADASGNPVVNGQYVLTDNLGSMDVATDTTGAVVTSTGFGFGAFGNRRDPVTLQPPQDSAQVTADRQKVTHRGFTGHEMLDSVGLVHMNGRVYDPNLGRFLSVDPMFAFPTNMQSLNPYSYVLNNPLSNTDPTGYNTVCIEDMGCIGGEGNRDAQTGKLIKSNADSQSNGTSGTGKAAAAAQQKDPTQAGEGDGTPHQVGQQTGTDSSKEAKPSDTLTVTYNQDKKQHNLVLNSPDRQGMLIEYGGRGFFFTQDALDYIKNSANFEGGYRQNAFPDGQGSSIGYGHHYDSPNGAGNAYPKGISEPSATELFNKDFANAAITVLRSIPQTKAGGEALADFSKNPSKLLAPADLAYNAHYHSNWQAFSLLRQHDFSGAASEFLNIDHYWDQNHAWQTSSQLEERRKEESDWLDPPQ